ncbi:hypothetical protein FPZ43_12710 [Mucilaginibacter pallidiroseus]|uniref:Uncharacterized protein n=1 Tax=Mucilaginibacter pallidiroseus TaxID=2599295 RepID=A0A563U7J8_9SPHI|nr:hypothetical protein [Mucilaginibacter pallidiroseus]TWR27341.1 hypothetical protein FPZ43_12710 [Mucilaginibacter pallidiroseus]
MKVAAQNNKPQQPGARLKAFKELAEQASLTFTFPAGFRETVVPNNEDFSFDYGMELPGKEFEIWFQVRSQKENWASYEKNRDDDKAELANPDSLYLGLGNATAIALTGETNFFTRTIPANLTARYNADGGRSYLLNLLDRKVTKRYKYALLVTLQKDHIGTVLAVCFSNEKGPDFFKYVTQASTCLKFKE